MIPISPTSSSPTSDAAARQEWRQQQMRVLDSFPTPTWRSGVDGLCDGFNRAWLEFTGRAWEQELGLGWTEGVHPDDLERCLKSCLQAFAARRPFQIEYRVRHADGGYRWVVDHAQPFEDPQGNFAGYIGSCHDVTQRKQAEDALYERECRFRKVFEEGPLGMALVDFNYRLLQVNARLCDLLGFERRELESRTIRDVTHPEDVDADFVLSQRLIAGKIPHYTVEKRYIRKNGDLMWGRLTVSLLTDDSGAPWYFLGMVEDVSARRQAGIALQQSEARFAAFMDNSPTLSFIRDEVGRYVYVNKTMQSLLRTAAADLEGETVFDRLPFDIARELNNNDLQVLRSQRPMQFEEFVRDYDGVERCWLASKFPMPGGEAGGGEAGGGETGRLVGSVVVDVTDRKRAERDLQERERRLSTLMDTAHEAIWVLDAAGQTQYGNQRLTELLGCPMAEILGRPMLDFVWEADAPEVRRQMARRLEGHKAQYDFRLCHRNGDGDGDGDGDGQARWVLVCGSPILDDAGAVTGMMELLTDITEGKQAEAELRQSEMRYRSLFELSPSPTLVYDCQSMDFVAVNEAAIAHYGYCKNEFLGLSLRDLLPFGEGTELLERLEAAPRGRHRYEKIQHRKKDGSLFYANIVTDDLTLDGRRVRLAVVDDITKLLEARRIEHFYTQRLQILREIDRAILAAESPRRIAEAAVERILPLLPCRRATVTMFDSGMQQATILATHCRDASSALTSQPYELDDFSRRYIPQLREEKICDYGDLGDVAAPPRWLQTLQSEGIRGGIAVPLVVDGELLGALNLWSERPGVFNPKHREIAREVASSLAVAIEQADLHKRVLEGSNRLQDLSLRLVEVQEAERRNLARELHDQIGQDLTALKMALEMAQRENEKRDTAQRDTAQRDTAQPGSAAQPGSGATFNSAQAQGMVSELMTRVRQLSFDLRPSMLDDLGLVPALLWHFEHYTRQTGIEVVFKQLGMSARFDPRSETAAYRIVQEALTNVARHAGVRQVTVRLWADSQRVGVQIEDEGRGFDPEAALSQGRTLGLASMRERAQLLGGTLSIESGIRGTGIRAELPLAAALLAAPLHLLTASMSAATPHNPLLAPP